MDILFPRSVLGPSVYEEQRLHELFQQLYRDWHAAKQSTLPVFKPENVRFERNPNWRNEFFSVTCVRDGNHWFWKATKVVWVLVGGAW